MKTKPELKPCPFCGSKSITVYIYKGSLLPLFSAECEECGCLLSGFDTKENAIKAWNRRKQDENTN